jgi:two-component system sensor histidine kinase VicK
MASADLVAYKHQLRERFKAIAPIFAKASIGDFSRDVNIPSDVEDEQLAEFFVGIQIILDAIREKIDESESALTRLNSVNAELQNDKAVYHAILSSIAEGLVVVDKDERITLINEAAADMLGIGAHSVLHQYYYDVVVTKSQDSKIVPVSKRPLHQAIVTGKKQSTGLSDGLCFIRSDGVAFPVAITASSVKLGKQVIGGVSTFHDISEEQQLDRTKSEIISIASHQLRTPLTAIKWVSEQLTTPVSKLSKAKQKQYLRQIHVSNDRMISLVNDLLNVSRIELGTLALNLKPFDLNDIVDDVLRDLRAQITLKRLKIKKHISADLSAVVTDARYMQVILQNLLSNAVKYSSDKKPIIIIVKKQDANLYLSIEDEGCGIPLNQQNQIFTKLFRADNARLLVSEGSGLGLYVCKAMVEQLGGKIWFESIEEQGTTFYITIPWIDK